MRFRLIAASEPPVAIAYIPSTAITASRIPNMIFKIFFIIAFNSF